MLQAGDLFHDRRNAFLDDRCDSRRSGRQAADIPSDALGRKLNRRERVLDFVRQPPRDFAPRARLLRAHDFCEVLDHENETAGHQA